MGYWLKQRLISTGAVTVGQTWRFKLPTVGFYSAFSVRFSCRREATRDDLALVPMLHELITKVEMTSEGIKVLKSMRAREMLALNLFDFGRPNEWQDGEFDTEYSNFTLYLLAGRGFQDKKWMWDMSRFTDPELAITNAVVDDDGTDFKEDDLMYQVFGWRWMGDPIPTPIGYMRADERLHYNTTGADVEKELTITRGHRIRRLLVMGWEPAHTLSGHIKRMELEVNEGEYHPVTYDNIWQACIQNKMDYNLDICVERYPYLYLVDNQHNVDACMCYPVGVQVTPYTGQADSACRVFTFNDGSLIVIPDVTCSAMVTSRGTGYMTSVLMGFDQHPELEDMLDTVPMSKLALELTETDADDTVSVVVEEEVLY